MNAKKRPASHSQSSNIHSRCLLNRVKAPLRVPKTQRETFLNNIVTANTVFLEKFTKKRYGYKNLPLSLRIFQKLLKQEKKSDN